MKEEVIGIKDRLKFYVACDWTGELDFYYFTQKARQGRGWESARRREIMTKARRLGAF